VVEVQRAGAGGWVLDDGQAEIGGAGFDGLQDAARHVMGVDVDWHGALRFGRRVESRQKLLSARLIRLKAAGVAA